MPPELPPLATVVIKATVPAPPHDGKDTDDDAETEDVREREELPERETAPPLLPERDDVGSLDAVAEKEPVAVTLPTIELDRDCERDADGDWGSDRDREGDGEREADTDAHTPAVHGLAAEKAGAPFCVSKETPLGELSTRYAPALAAASSKTVWPGPTAAMLPAAACVSGSGPSGGANAPM